MTKIKDYIIDLSKTNESETLKIKRKKSNVTFSLVLENDTDFVINRKSTKTDKDLVFLVSQELFYIKDNKTEEIKPIDSNNMRKEIGNFNRNLKEWIKFEKVSWTGSNYDKNLYEIIKNPAKIKLIKYGYKLDKYYELDFLKLIEENNKLFKAYYTKMKGNINLNIAKSIFLLCNMTDYNNAFYFIGCLSDLKIYRGGYLFDTIKLLELYPEFDTNSFIHYITYGLYSQGITEINYNEYSIYRDYLQTSKIIYGKVKEKYPLNLKTEHDKMYMRYNLIMKYKKDSNIKLIYDENKDFEFKNKDYSIILPQSSSDIIDEGINQSHCVGTYVDKVVNHETLICFMRETNFIEKSLITIEVKNKSILQIRGFANRLPEKNEKNFIKKWAKEKDLKICC